MQSLQLGFIERGRKYSWRITCTADRICYRRLIRIMKCNHKSGTLDSTTHNHLDSLNVGIFVYVIEVTTVVF